MIEIYREKSSKEQVFDLLAGYQRKKVEREYSTGSSHVVKSSQELLARLSEGAALRNTDKTDGNARSSRSHAIFTVRLSYTRQDSDSRQQRVNGRFLLVDLAGAESASTADVGSFQQRQGSGINTGLSALQTVIMEASETPEAHGGVVKYRLSKLTYILRPALGGEGGRQGCNVIFVGCINPLAGKGSRTRTTLQYISQAAKIKNVVQADVESLESRRDRVLAQQIDVLKSQNRELAAELQATKTAYQTTGTFDGTQSGIAAPTQSRFVDGPSASRIVVLSVEEHTALLRQVQESNDMVAALEVVLKRNVEEHERLERELGSAVKRAEEAQKAAVDGRSSAGAGSTPQATDAAPSPLLPFEVAGCKSTAVSPGLSALAVSPILAAARAMLDTAGSLSFSPEDLARHEPLAVEDICLNEEESNLEPDQFVVLRRLIENRLEDAAQKCADVDDNRQAPSSTSQPCGDDAGQTILTGVGGKEDAELVAALHRRTAEVAALRLAVSAYNECLGTVASELDIVRARELEVTTHLQQAAREKVQYVELAAKFDQALDVSQFDVLDLQTQVQQMQRRQSLTSNNNNNNNGNGGGILGRMVLGRYGSGTSGSTTPRGSITSSSPGQLSPQRQSSNAPSRSGSSRRSSAFQAIGSLFRASVSPAAETSGLVLHEEEKKEEEEEGLMGADSDSDCDEKCGHTVPHTVPPSRLEPVGSEVIVLGPTPPAQMKLHVGRLDAFPIENLTLGSFLTLKSPFSILCSLISLM